MKIYPNPSVMIHEMGQRFISGSSEVQKITPSKWQGIKNENPILEIFDVILRTEISESFHAFRNDCNPDLPWAEDHFKERISGCPTNPGKTYSYWPYYKEDKFRTEEGIKFSHTYQERFWPKFANQLAIKNKGIRYSLGDLNDLINHLIEYPDTRQAYLPVWFPEDTGVIHGGRVPCTLGYLFNIRNGYLHCSYYLRSCDYTRHFKNDVYLAGRLMQYVRNKITTRSKELETLKLGRLKIDIESFHIFESDLYEIKKRLKK